MHNFINRTSMIVSAAVTAFVLVQSGAKAADYQNLDRSQFPGLKPTLAPDNQPSSDLGVSRYISLFGGGSMLNQNLNEEEFDLFTNLIPTAYGAINYPTKAGFVFGGAFGVKWNDHVRTEAELSHQQWSLDQGQGTFIGITIPPKTIGVDGTVSTNLLMANLWYDFKNSSPFTPYLGGGAGIGMATVDFTGDYAKPSPYSQTPSLAVAVQLGGGVIFDINDSVAVDLGYRFKDVAGLDFDSVLEPALAGTQKLRVTNVSLPSHNVQAGLTIKF